MTGNDAIAIILFVLVYRLFASPNFRDDPDELVLTSPTQVVEVEKAAPMHMPIQIPRSDAYPEDAAAQAPFDSGDYEPEKLIVEGPIPGMDEGGEPEL